MRFFVSIACLVAVIFLGLAEASIEVASLEGDQVEILVKLEGVEDIRDEQGNWLGIRLPDFYSLGFESLGVWIPVNALLLGAPPDGDSHCDVVDAFWHEIPAKDGTELLRRLGEKVNELPTEPAWISSDGFYRHRRIIGLRLSPLIFDGSSGKIRIFDSFRVRVGFSGKGLHSLSSLPLEDSKTSSLFEAALINYKQAENWLEPLQTKDVNEYFTSSPNWVKLFVDTTGIYCLTGRDLASAGVSIVDADTKTIRMYSGGGLHLSESLADTNAPWMRQIPLLIRDGGDNRFDQNDSLIFYGIGLRDWAYHYDPDLGKEDFFKHFYSRMNCYWLTWGGAFPTPAKGMETRSLPECDGCSYTDVKSFRERVHLEEDTFERFSIRADDGWYWEYLIPGTKLEVRIPTPSSDDSSPGHLKVRFGSDEHPGDTSYYYYVKLIFGQKEIEKIWKAMLTAWKVIDVVDTVSVSQSEFQILKIEMPQSLPNPDSRKVYDRLVLGWVELYYDRKLETSRNSLFFDSPESSGTFRFEIGGFSSPSVYVFDVTDQFNAKRLENFDISPGYKVVFYDTVSVGRRYAVVGRDAMLKPRAIEVAHIEGIRDKQGGAYCIITHRDLLSAAELLASFHKERGSDVEVVTVDEIYDEFGWGIPDVTAIRDFLRWRYWRDNLGLVLLLGDATWDVMGRKGQSGNPNYVPTYEKRFLPPVGDSYNTDDWFAYLEPCPGCTTAKFPTVGISRLPAVSPQDAIDLAERTIEYMSNPEIGNWQNRVILIADDDWAGSRCDAIPHTYYAEELGDRAIPPEFEQIKIYLTEYPRDLSGQKPGARKDLIENLNKGALITDFTGHGDPLRLTQEEVYNRATLTEINNGRRRTFFIAASCNVSRFDDLSGSSIAEDLLRRAEGGTIGSLGSTHLCKAADNQLLNLNFLEQVFKKNFKSHPVPIGDALSLAKMVISSLLPPLSGIQKNNEMYALFGDPALTLAHPRFDMKFEKAFSDTLQKRGGYSFSASVVDSTGNPVTSFSGEAMIIVREPEDTSGYQPCAGLFFDYEIPGDEIFRGKTSVASGGFDSKFFIFSSAKTGTRATVRCFASDGQNSAVGLIDSLFIYGSAPAEDNTGPELEAFLGDRKIENGDTLMVGDRVEIRLRDDSGIALRGKSRLLPGVIAIFDGTQAVEIGDSLIALDGDYKKWVTSFRVPAIPGGQHNLNLTASDNIGNMTSEEYEVYVSAGVFEAANLAFAYPNPAHDKCYIIWQYDCNSTTEVEIDVSIFTISGRKIWKDCKTGQGPYQEIVWHCTDMVGDQVANGTYIAFVESRSPDDPTIKTKDRIVIMVAR